MNEDGWINHGERTICPIPWAKPGEYCYTLANGHLVDKSFHSASQLDWRMIDSYQLTGCWQPVLNGKPPLEAKGGEWEWRDPEGTAYRPDTGTLTIGSEFWSKPRVVAARLITKQAERDISAEAGLLHDRPYNKEPVKATKATKVRDIFAEAGWFHVYAGKCNEKHLFHGELFEHLLIDGTFITLPYSGSFASDVVAARRVKPEKRAIKPIKNWADYNETHKLADDLLKEMIRLKNLDASQPLIFTSQHLDATNWNAKDFHAEEYHYCDRDAAYMRFRQSPRGKEALAMIGKAEGPTFKPLGQCEIERLIMETLEGTFK